MYFMTKNKFCSCILTIFFGLTLLVCPSFATAAEKSEPPKEQEKVLELNKPEVTVSEIAPGLTEKVYKVRYQDSMVTAYFLEADKDYYSIIPALDHNKIVGRDTVSNIAKEHGAIAAINASYFAVNGVILGVTKIDGKVVGTTYFTRTALGIREDGAAHIGKVGYDGYVTINGVTLPVSGVNVECPENGLVIYNKFYGNTTNTNEYGMEYIIKDEKVVDINKHNSEIPEDGVVVFVHGTSKDAYKDIFVGDRAIVSENLGEPWNEDLHILGVGPRLVEDGEIHVTANEEEFPNDIKIGRAPRAGFGITREGNYLFAVVDGRQKISRGATLAEFAALLRDFGAFNAINFDGGGSSTLFLDGKIINSPSDGKERKVGDALLLVEK